ncbi:hypothetical protein GPAL_3564 [Glaciecola pallidula DSM 14239 = ACAM 615]|uniref:Uncharacterized protein n=1 Tax=Brumicola pallidula DSM 14239 = ACAM 615 TaxID=1121922 RepID=K7A4K0_9ALTE|nr:hypothetical protein GPAL_3564 [Glaciecola pallidula DSM 14239 = ACAM 615]
MMVLSSDRKTSNEDGFAMGRDDVVIMLELIRARILAIAEK